MCIPQVDPDELWLPPFYVPSEAVVVVYDPANRMSSQYGEPDTFLASEILGELAGEWIGQGITNETACGWSIPSASYRIF